MSFTHSGVKKSIIMRVLVVRKGLLRIPDFGEVIYVGFRGDSPTFACLWIFIAHDFCFLFLPDAYFFPLNTLFIIFMYIIPSTFLFILTL